MTAIDKKSLSERDICTKFITPAITKAGWDIDTQVREEFSFTKGRIIVRGKLVSRGRAKRADYILYYKPNIPLALIEAKDNTHGVGDPASFICAGRAPAGATIMRPASPPARST